MTIQSIFKAILVPALGVVLAWSTFAGVGCSGEFLDNLGLNSQVPTTPGQNPYIVLRWTNSVEGPDQSGDEPNDPAGVLFSSTWYYAGGSKDQFSWGGAGLAEGEDFGILLPCTVTTLTVGDVDDTTSTGAWLSFASTDSSYVVTPLPPFGKNLSNGVDFRCGDVITFMIQPAADVAAQYTITYRVDSGEDEAGPYSGPDTFSNIKRMTADWENTMNVSSPF